jgi:hypothetical protein
MNYEQEETKMVDLQEVFSTIKKELSAYQPPFQPKNDTERYFDLWSFKDLVIEGRKRKEVFFAGAIIQKDYVGFYYIPLYAGPEVKALFKPELLKLLKGKSCFHLKKLDEELITQIRQVLLDGYTQYRKRGWV